MCEIEPGAEICDITDAKHLFAPAERNHHVGSLVSVGVGWKVL